MLPNCYYARTFVDNLAESIIQLTVVTDFFAGTKVFGLVEFGLNLHDFFLNRPHAALVCVLPQTTERAQTGGSQNVPTGLSLPHRFLLNSTSKRLSDTNYGGIGFTSNSSLPTRHNFTSAMNH